jgi:hypothetical protein
VVKNDYDNSNGIIGIIHCAPITDNLYILHMYQVKNIPKVQESFQLSIVGGLYTLTKEEKIEGIPLCIIMKSSRCMLPDHKRSSGGNNIFFQVCQVCLFFLGPNRILVLGSETKPALYPIDPRWEPSYRFVSDVSPGKSSWGEIGGK